MFWNSDVKKLFLVNFRYKIDDPDIVCVLDR